MRTFTFACCTLLLIQSCSQDPRTLQEALGDVQVTDDWIYENIEAGYSEAKKTGKPLLVSFR
ncbi:MAG: hypothetical protein ACYTG5_16195 [Planctomycetota bacterium]|jgi:hypothetical protein